MMQLRTLLRIFSQIFLVALIAEENQKRNPDVKVNPCAGEVYPKTPERWRR